MLKWTVERNGTKVYETISQVDAHKFILRDSARRRESQSNYQQVITTC